ncbi:MAG: Uma2 family endonuclease [Pirellulales bacterium]|nr:Uma2 family endonuclease [Pirellulales bacterium]
MSLAPTKYRLSVAEFQRMGESGIFPPEARLELIAGEIIEMSPIGALHAAYVSLLSRIFSNQVAEPYIIFVQNPIQLADSQPQPDLAILLPHPKSYRHHLPTAADTLLIVEVSDSTLDYDREVKLPLYAGAGIPEVWIVNLQEDQLEVYTQPAATGYLRSRYIKRTETYESEILPGLKLSPAAILDDPE